MYTLLRPDSVPLESTSTFRVAPSIAAVASAMLWRFWVVSNELYASNRSGGHLAKFSFHFSGAAHMQLGQDKRQVLGRPMKLVSSDWLHALEIRFLLSLDANRPMPEKLKRKDRAFLVAVPDPVENVLCLNLLITATRHGSPPPLPTMMGGAVTLWASRLKDGYPVVLLARQVPMSGENQQRLDHIRKERQPRANFDTQPEGPVYVEVRHVFWDLNGATVVLVVPMGIESVSVKRTANAHT